MDRADIERRLILYRNLALAAAFLALAGWGTAFSVKAVGQRQFREEAAQLKVDQEQLREERDQAKMQLAAAQQEVVALTKRVDKLQMAAASPVPTPVPSIKSEAAKGKRR